MSNYAEQLYEEQMRRFRFVEESRPTEPPENEEDANEIARTAEETPNE